MISLPELTVTAPLDVFPTMASVLLVQDSGLAGSTSPVVVTVPWSDESGLARKTKTTTTERSNFDMIEICRKVADTTSLQEHKAAQTKTETATTSPNAGRTASDTIGNGCQNSITDPLVPNISEPHNPDSGLNRKTCLHQVRSNYAAGTQQVRSKYAATTQQVRSKYAAGTQQVSPF